MYPLFFYNRRAWEELYAIIFRFFDQKWNIMKVGYMGFQKVIDATESEISELIKKRSVMQGQVMVPAIFDMLGILLENLDSFRTQPVAETRIGRSATMVDFRPVSGIEDDEEEEEDFRLEPNIELLDLSSIKLDDIPLRENTARRTARRRKRCRSAQPTTPGREKGQQLN